MDFNPFTIIKSLLIKEENTLTPKQIEIVPGGTANTKTTLVGSQTTDKTLTLPNATDTLTANAATQSLTNKTIDADLNTITNIENADIKVGAAIDAAKIHNGSVSNTEFGYLDGVTSSIQTQLNTNATNIADHISDAVGAHAASAISNTPAGTIAATDLQAAVNELDGDIQAHINDTVGAHGAGAISNTPSGNLVATDVQGALNEIQTELDAAVIVGNNAATRTLNNLTTTSLNADLLPSGAGARNLGSSSLPFGTTNTETLTRQTAGSLTLSTSSGSLLLNPSTIIDANNKIVSNLAAPVSAGDAVNKEYADSIAAGFDPKAAVRVATTASLGGSYTTTPSNGRFTGAATVVDGVTLAANDRVLVKDQVDLKQNGIYVYDGAGQYTRAADSDGTPAAEVSSGNFTFATQGTINSAAGFVLLGNGILTLNTDNLAWTQSSGGSGGASRFLDNLLSPVAINQDLLPGTAGTRDIGSISLPFAAIRANNLVSTELGLFDNIGGNSRGIISASSPKILSSGDVSEFTIWSPNNNSVDIGIQAGDFASNQTGSVFVNTGNPNANLNSGNIKLYTGTVSGTGIRGEINLNARQINANSTKIVNLATPTVGSDAANKSYVDGSAVIGNLEALFAQTFNNAVLADFTQTNLELITVNPIDGSQSAKLPHAAASTNLFSQTIAVDRKFRGISQTISMSMQSTASTGNVVLKITDLTNAVDIIASESLPTFSTVLTSVTLTTGSPSIVVASQAEVNEVKVGMRVTGSGIAANSLVTAVNTSTRTLTLNNNATATVTSSLRISALPEKRSVSFLIPANCASISYTISALQEANIPETYVDDLLIEIAEFAKTSTSVEVPIVTEWQAYTPTFTGFGTVSVSSFQYRRVGASLEIRGRLTAGTTAASEARISLPNSLTSVATIATLEKAGSVDRSSGFAAGYFYPTVLIQPSVSYLTFGAQGSGTAALVKRNASDVFLTGEAISLFASVPIATWVATEAKNIELTSSVLSQEQDSMVRLNTANGYGSTAVAVRRFTTIQQNIGDGILYQDSAVNGSSFTVLKDGEYSFTYGESFSAAGDFGLTKNQSNLALTLDSVPQIERLIQATTNAASQADTVTWTGLLLAGDIVRPITNSGAIGLSNRVSFIASYAGKLKQLNINPNSKITIPTSELRFEGASTRGSTATAIVRFDALAKLRGDAFTVASDATNGTAITMRKAGKLDVSASLYSANTNVMTISRNQSVLTNPLPTGSEALATDGNQGTNESAGVSWSGFVQVGDVIRVALQNNPTNTINQNSLNLAFQEQEIAVSVTNVQPKFSDADSSVRVDTANGFGSTATRIRRFSNVRENLGVDVEYVDSAVNGASFIAKSDGIYEISYSGSTNATSTYIGISKNSNQLTTDIPSINRQDRLAIQYVAGNGEDGNCAWSGYLLAGDVIRPHGSGVANTDRADREHFTMSKVGKPNITSVDVTPFVNIPQPVTGHARLDGTAARASTATFIVFYPNISLNNSNGLFSITTDSVLGTRITVLKAGVISLSATIGASFANQGSRITRNQAVLTANPTLEENLAATQHASGATSQALAWTGPAVIGDVFRVNTDNTVNGSAYNSLSVSMECPSDQIVTELESFSSDTAPFVYAGSATYTLATLQNAPVGTFITFTYAASTNVRTQTNAAAPTQTVSDMSVNGILLTARPFNTTSTSATPAVIAIQIGKGLKGRSIDFFGSIGKTNPGPLDYSVVSSVNERGTFVYYDEKTGILQLDAGYCSLGTNTSRNVDSLGLNSNGYILINASKNPALAGLNSKTPVVAASYWLSATASVGSNAVINYDSKEFDPYNAVTTGAGWRFTCPNGEAGYYLVTGAVDSSVGSSMILFRDGTAYKTLGYDNAAVNSVFSGIVYLNEKQFIDLRPGTGGSFSGNSLAFSTNNINIIKVG
jgi:hypothetical protein